MEAGHTISVEEAAKWLGVTIETIRRYLRRGELRGYRLGKKSGWRIQPSDLEDLVRRRTNQPQGGEQ